MILIYDKDAILTKYKMDKLCQNWLFQTRLDSSFIPCANNVFNYIWIKI